MICLFCGFQKPPNWIFAVIETGYQLHLNQLLKTFLVKQKPWVRIAWALSSGFRIECVCAACCCHTYLTSFLSCRNSASSWRWAMMTLLNWSEFWRRWMDICVKTAQNLCLAMHWLELTAIYCQLYSISELLERYAWLWLSFLLQLALGSCDDILLLLLWYCLKLFFRVCFMC